MIFLGGRFMVPIGPSYRAHGESEETGLDSSPVRQSVSPRTASRQHGNRERLRPCVSPSQSILRGTVRDQDGLLEPRRRSIVAPASRWERISGMWAARSARNRKVSVRGLTPFSIPRRTVSPSQPRVGSLVRKTEWPWDRRRSFTSRLTVVLPDPSIPSNVTKPESTEEEQSFAH